MFINFKKTHPNFKTPIRAHPSDAGIDCFSVEKIVIPKKTNIPIKVNLGFALEIPIGYYGMLTSKSGLASNFGIITIPGTIDSEYRGEMCAMMINISEKDFTFNIGDKVCQLIIIPIVTPEFKEKQELETSNRNTKGFGSTGYK